ncbi:MAG: DUF2397 family protein [Planctomycetota bacterium]|nr:MAG: DUF2397 family protein [Planctomycetota bacterium]REJ92095.1 MAG: DUF2397 family protein [Planctomycetota bacterium]REK28631.1 MAG: DUF2397 family protein [Planctomycetota bacterium]REK39245.1 MAG: DUF2397 family protein [Planctomycetota bacterium]
MRIWDYSLQQVLAKLDCNQFRFLTNAPAEPYVAILVALYRARQEEMQLEIPLVTLYERVLPVLQKFKAESDYDRTALRSHLNTLVDWGNVSMRLEPRRIRRIQDRGLERYLVRMTETTSAILSQLESHVDSISEDRTASARFSLQDVDDFLAKIVDVLGIGDEADHDDLCRVGRQLAHARMAVEEAGEELLRLDLWLSEMAIQIPDRDRLTELLTQLQTYFERYLQEIDQLRERSHVKLIQLVKEGAAEFFDRVRDAMELEYANDPTRQGLMRPPEPIQIIRAVQEFLEPEGILDARRKAVHERLADVTGHLKRYLTELVRRSQLVAGLRELSDRLLRTDNTAIQNGRLETLFLDLWQPAHAVLDENRGKPTETVEPPRPPRSYTSAGHRFMGASIRPSANGRATSKRPALIKQMQDLNEFVQSVILRGNPEAFVSEAELRDWSQVKMLFAAIRFARLDGSHLRKRYLRYRIAFPTVSKVVTLPTRNDVGNLTLPQMVFSQDS